MKKQEPACSMLPCINRQMQLHPPRQPASTSSACTVHAARSPHQASHAAASAVHASTPHASTTHHHPPLPNADTNVGASTSTSHAAASHSSTAHPTGNKRKGSPHRSAESEPQAKIYIWQTNKEIQCFSRLVQRLLQEKLFCQELLQPEEQAQEKLLSKISLICYSLLQKKLGEHSPKILEEIDSAIAFMREAKGDCSIFKKRLELELAKCQQKKSELKRVVAQLRALLQKIQHLFQRVQDAEARKQARPQEFDKDVQTHVIDALIREAYRQYQQVLGIFKLFSQEFSSVQAQIFSKSMKIMTDLMNSAFSKYLKMCEQGKSCAQAHTQAQSYHIIEQRIQSQIHSHDLTRAAEGENSADPNIKPLNAAERERLTLTFKNLIAVLRIKKSEIQQAYQKRMKYTSIEELEQKAKTMSAVELQELLMFKYFQRDCSLEKLLQSLQIFMLKVQYRNYIYQQIKTRIKQERKTNIQIDILREILGAIRDEFFELLWFNARLKQLMKSPSESLELQQHILGIYRILSAQWKMDEKIRELLLQKERRQVPTLKRIHHTSKLYDMV